ncbi:MAG: hypothetical protein RLY86_4383 [Pseudomonadota bacterium]|jgi:hypothetical protein
MTRIPSRRRLRAAILSAALVTSALVTTALPAAAAITKEVEANIQHTARGGDVSRTAAAITAATTGHPAEAAKAWSVALTAVKAQKARNPKAVGHMAAEASAAAADIAKTDPAAALDLAKESLVVAADVSNQAQAYAMTTAKSSSHLARTSFKANPSRAVEIVLTAIAVAGPLQGVDKAAGSAIAADAKAVADQFRTSNTAVSGQIMMALSKARLKV